MISHHTTRRLGRALRIRESVRMPLLAPLRTRYHVAEVLGGTLLVTEIGVLVAAPAVGALLLGTTAGLGGITVRGLIRMERRAAGGRGDNQPANAGPGMSDDGEGTLPGRQQLIDQLAREIARTQRYGYDMSIAIIGVSQFEGLRASWGSAMAGNAVAHVGRTLQRITRVSDFLARIDDSRFAVVLMQCNAEQAGLFGERASLAASNRPLIPATGVRVPLYVSVETTALQYQPSKYRGPLDFLSAAGGDVAPPTRQQHRALGSGRADTGVRGFADPDQPRGNSRAADPRALRQQLVRDYRAARPMGVAEGFGTERARARRAI